MSDIKKAALKVAQANPEFARLLKAELSKKAGGYTKAIKGNGKVTVRMLQNFVYKSNEFDKDWLDKLDWKKMEFDGPIAGTYAGLAGKDCHTIWRVFPQGSVGDRQSDYIWGKISTSTGSGRGGAIEVQTFLYLKI
jgi:hypothetical protein